MTHPKREDYKKLKVTNNWGTLTYKVGKTKLKQKNQIVWILWPDGSESKHFLRFREYIGSTYDHGHEYSYTTPLAFITITYHRHLITLEFQDTPDDLKFYVPVK